MVPEVLRAEMNSEEKTMQACQQTPGEVIRMRKTHICGELGSENPTLAVCQ
jgi:hypothetical protein